MSIYIKSVSRLTFTYYTSGKYVILELTCGLQNSIRDIEYEQKKFFRVSTPFVCNPAALKPTANSKNLFRSFNADGKNRVYDLSISDRYSFHILTGNAMNYAYTYDIDNNGVTVYSWYDHTRSVVTSSWEHVELSYSGMPFTLI